MDINSKNPLIGIERRAHEAGITIAKLCEKAGLARSTFTRGKSDMHSPNWSTLQSLENALSELTNSVKENRT